MAILTAVINTLIVLICLFLICLILIQRGKGGGLAGAFGGVGGSSAFGTKSGDVFTRVTMIVAGVWIVLSMVLVILYNQGSQSAWGNDTNTSLSKQVTPKSREKGTTAGSRSTSGTGAATPGVPPISTPAPAASTTSPVDAAAIPETPSTKK